MIPAIKAVFSNPTHMNHPDPAIAQAFESAHYEITAPDGETVVLRIGLHDNLDRLLLQCNATSIAILTAWNPGGKRTSDSQNERAQARLQERIRSLNLRMLNGRNLDPNGVGPTEPTCVLLDASHAQTRALASLHDQLAYVYASMESPPALIWL